MTERVATKPLLLGRIHTGPTSPDGTPGGSLIRVWCPFCLVRHEHGWKSYVSDSGGQRVQFEHRVAHCAQGSPLRDGGYWIAEEGYESEVACGIKAHAKLEMCHTAADDG